MIIDYYHVNCITMTVTVMRMINNVVVIIVINGI